MPKLKTFKASEVDNQFRSDMLDLFNKYAGKMPASSMLALASYTVGQILALQDQRNMTIDDANTIIMSNIEAGNRQVIDELMNNTKGKA